MEEAEEACSALLDCESAKCLDSLFSGPDRWEDLPLMSSVLFPGALLSQYEFLSFLFKRCGPAWQRSASSPRLPSGGSDLR